MLLLTSVYLLCIERSEKQFYILTAIGGDSKIK